MKTRKAASSLDVRSLAGKRGRRKSEKRATSDHLEPPLPPRKRRRAETAVVSDLDEPATYQENEVISSTPNSSSTGEQAALLLLEQAKTIKNTTLREKMITSSLTLLNQKSSASVNETESGAATESATETIPVADFVEGIIGQEDSDDETGDDSDDDYNDVPSSGFNKAGHQLGKGVPEKIKDRIKKNKYIDLARLLPNEKHLDETKIAVKEGSGILKLEKKSTTKIIYTIDQWVTAFIVYIAIMAPSGETTSGLMKYMDFVRKIAKRGGDWKFYDEEFRNTRVNSELAWSQPDQELWQEAQLRGKPQFGKDKKGASYFTSQNTYGQLSGRVPQGFCFRFHNGSSHCTSPNCSFNHSCFKCHKGKHPALKCRSQPQSRQFKSNNFRENSYRSNNFRDQKSSQSFPKKSADTNKTR